MNELMRPCPRPTAQVEVYVEVLGVELAVAFLLAFGGAELHLSDGSNSRSRVAALVGVDKAAALGTVAHRMQKRVPLAKAWTAAVLHWQGHSIAEIARRLHATDISVRGWLRREAERQAR